jgi:mRNA-degrading endonuclease RelE of RelBE toxin-antitoxin system
MIYKLRFHEAALTEWHKLEIKLKAAGYRLVYRVEDEIVFVTVISIGKRERSLVYAEAKRRLAGK